MNKLKALFRVFQVGHSVADPAQWKAHQISGSMLAALMAAVIALARSFGYEVAMSDADMLTIGSALVIVWSFVNSGLTIATTDKIGLPSNPVMGIPISEIRDGNSRFSNESSTYTSAPELPALPEQPKPPVPRERYIAKNGEIRDAARRE